ncbi:hypothetical protein [Fodinicola feengrottensis]|uniref:Uncharacterized protein n=1 Tax=Fodinicola feengrottensis TaxID=435914 RepID=A0ABP4RM05_9ACTN|nr:hypothetical protein [Fodinicola feengrottensis]
MIRCPGHQVVAPSRLHAEAVLEGHVDLLRGTCDDCQLTVVGINVGNGRDVVWFPVAEIVTHQRHYQRKLAGAAPLDPRLTNGELLPTLLAEGKVALAAAVTGRGA